MTNLLIHVDLGNYNDKEVYLYTSATYHAPRLFIILIIVFYLNGLLKKVIIYASY